MVSMKLDPSIQTLRGLACVLLVFFHVVGSNPSFGLRVADGGLRTLTDALAYVRMPLFAVLAGYAYGLRPVGADAKGFLAGKVRRLLVPMLVVGTAFAIVQSWVPGTNVGGRNWLVLHLEPVGHLWFIESLFWVFALVALIERTGVLRTAASFALVWSVAAVIYLGIRGPHWLGIEGAIYLLPYFLAGLAIRRFALEERLRQRGVVLVLVTIAWVAVGAIGLPVSDPDRRTVWMLLAGLSACALLLAARPCTPWLARLGTASYAIFLYHVFFTAFARIALESFDIRSLAIHCIAGLVLGLAGPIWIRRMASGHPWSHLLMLGESRRGRASAVAGAQVHA